MNQESLIFRLLLSPRFRKWRYLALVAFFFIISLNQAIVGYWDIIPLMGNNIYWIVAVTILVYIISVFLLSKIVSKCLLVGKYLKAILYVIFFAILYLIISNLIFGSYIHGYDLLSESVLIDNISAFAIYLLCISGVFIPIFLKNWLMSNQQLNELKIKQKSSEVEQFKEQISPIFFFKILSKCNSYVIPEPEKASDMLVKFGKLLRYQLYDCNREKVLLKSEINFVQNFLELEKMRSSKFDFELNVVGNTNGIFIPPSVLLPYVQNVVNITDDEKERKIGIRIDTFDDTITIILKVSGIDNTLLLQKKLLKVRERLNILYHKKYTLTVSADKLTCGIDIMLVLNKK